MISDTRLDFQPLFQLRAELLSARIFFELFSLKAIASLFEHGDFLFFIQPRPLLIFEDGARGVGFIIQFNIFEIKFFKRLGRNERNPADARHFRADRDEFIFVLIEHRIQPRPFGFHIIGKRNFLFKLQIADLFSDIDLLRISQLVPLEIFLGQHSVNLSMSRADFIDDIQSGVAPRLDEIALESDLFDEVILDVRLLSVELDERHSIDRLSRETAERRCELPPALNIGDLPFVFFFIFLELHTVDREFIELQTPKPARLKLLIQFPIIIDLSDIDPHLIAPCRMLI